MKRVFDLFVSSTLLLFCLPLLLFIALLIRLKLGSPIIFKQERPGFRGRIFQMIKFRTMAEVYDKSGALCPDEDRLTTFGKVLRASSLDELPGLISVIKGDMSLVGPRPLLVEYLPLYSNEQARRHDVLPGITGWAQVNGRNALTWEQKFELDIWYVENHSFLLDLKILFLTVKKVIARDGISADGHVTIEPFRGTKNE